MKGGFRSPRHREGGEVEGPFAPHQIKLLVKAEFDRSKRYGHPLTLGVLKVDRLETLVDHHGHRVRDMIQATVARVLRRDLRSSDLLGRHSEDRFLLLLPHTDQAGALDLARRVLKRIAEFALEVGSKVLNITASMGLACYADRSALFCDEIMAQAELALDRAREAGGNEIEIGEATPPGPDGGEGTGGIPEPEDEDGPREAPRPTRRPGPH
jgi:diguanylate cyclase (GGDEF)-like protein